MPWGDSTSSPTGHALGGTPPGSASGCWTCLALLGFCELGRGDRFPLALLGGRGCSCPPGTVGVVEGTWGH